MKIWLTMKHLFLITFLYGLGLAQTDDRGSINVVTLPDSAMVVLDDFEEAEPELTPYFNENMVPGLHQVYVLPNSPTYKSTFMQTLVKKNQTNELFHRFLYRNKSFRNEHLSSAPWRLNTQMGFTWAKVTGNYEKDEYSPNSATDTVLAAKPLEANDQFTNSMIPLSFKLGLPNNIELHTEFPWSKYGKGNDIIWAMGDILIGGKYTHQPLQTAFDLSFKFNNASSNQGGNHAYGIRIGAATLQHYEGAELYGSAWAQYNGQNKKDSKINVGEEIHFYAQAGYLLDIFLPFLAIDGGYKLADDILEGSTAIKDYDSIRVDLKLGMIVDLNADLTAQLAIPFSVYGRNSIDYWGIELSANFGSYLIDEKPKGKSTNAQELVPLNSGSVILFDKTETTNREYREFCDQTGAAYPKDPEFDAMPNYFTSSMYEDHPVVNVPYRDAKKYAQWIGKRLPTEEEWQDEFGNLKLESKQLACGLASPEQVNAFYQNGGMFNLIGNVAEWIEDGDGDETTVLHAGGSYFLPSSRCLNPKRLIDIASPLGAKYIGFRLVKEVE